MDIATLLESHRRYMLEQTSTLYTKDEEDEAGHALQVMGAAHDRATTKTLLDYVRSGQTGNGELKPLGQAALTAPMPQPSRGVKAGSKKARDRAAKAVETRRKNLADKKAGAPAVIDESYRKGVGDDPGEPALSPATHLVPRPPEGGAA